MKILPDSRCKTYTVVDRWRASEEAQAAQKREKPWKNGRSFRLRTYLLHGIGIAVYIAGQERRLVDPPSQVVAGVRTVTTTMNGRGTLPRCRAYSLFITDLLAFSSPFLYSSSWYNLCPARPAMGISLFNFAKSQGPHLR
jgi:hypothetical protein